MQPTAPSQPATMTPAELAQLAAALTRYQRHVILCEPQDRALVTVHLVGRLQDRLAGSIARRGGCRTRGVAPGPKPTVGCGEVRGADTDGLRVPAAPCSPDRQRVVAGRIGPAFRETSEGTARVSSGPQGVSSGPEGRRQSLTDDATRCVVEVLAAGGAR